MNATRPCIFAVLWLALCTPAIAQPLVRHAIDLELHGDDPGEVLSFDLVPDLQTPLVVRLDGYYQNLVAAETVVRYDLWWTAADGHGLDGRVGPDWTPLLSAAQLPLAFEHEIGFTPATVDFLVEGGGSDDHLRFVGELTIWPVPEPGTAALLGAAAVAGLSWRRQTARRRNAAGAIN